MRWEWPHWQGHKKLASTQHCKYH